MEICAIVSSKIIMSLCKDVCKELSTNFSVIKNSDLSVSI